MRAFRALQQRGVQRVGLGVDARNKTGATRLYERVGMHVDQELVSYEIELRPGRDLAVVDWVCIGATHVRKCVAPF